MPEDTFRIRIKRDGSIYFYSQQLGEERMRALREMIEDSLGPIAEVRQPDDDGFSPGVKMVDEETQDHLKHQH